MRLRRQRFANPRPLPISFSLVPKPTQQKILRLLPFSLQFPSGFRDRFASDRVGHSENFRTFRTHALLDQGSFRKRSVKRYEPDGNVQTCQSVASVKNTAVQHAHASL